MYSRGFHLKIKLKPPLMALYTAPHRFYYKRSANPLATIPDSQKGEQEPVFERVTMQQGSLNYSSM